MRKEDVHRDLAKILDSYDAMRDLSRARGGNNVENIALARNIYRDWMREAQKVVKDLLVLANIARRELEGTQSFKQCFRCKQIIFSNEISRELDGKHWHVTCIRDT